jgi:hypothetical protein
MHAALGCARLVVDARVRDAGPPTLARGWWICGRISQTGATVRRVQSRPSHRQTRAHTRIRCPHLFGPLSRGAHLACNASPVWPVASARSYHRRAERAPFGRGMLFGGENNVNERWNRHDRASSRLSRKASSRTRRPSSQRSRHPGRMAKPRDRSPSSRSSSVKCTAVTSWICSRPV